MLRGVNKKIIEVMDTQNDYFERAILFLKEQRVQSTEADIKKNADAFLQHAGAHHLGRNMRIRVALEAGKLLLAGAFGFGLALMLFGL